jgi:excisionase family DNA binding protein
MVSCRASGYRARVSNEPTKTLTISITGNLSITQEQLEDLVRHLPTSIRDQQRPPQGQSVRLPEEGKPPRLAYTVKETAEILGISQQTVYRLLARGLLRCSLALRNKIIARSEIERFLKDTSSDVWL